MNNSNLAIIIPAYKKAFLRKALESIALQTNRRFNVYIGDDHSPENLKEIVDEFQSQLNIHFIRFSENMGGEDLVGQWERCIDLSEHEEWVWLFSDDDEMEPTCVHDFYRELDSTNDNFDLYHFNVRVIDEQSKIIEELAEFPDTIISREFFKLKSRGNIKSYVVEYVFRRATFLDIGGFQKFDLAWYTDDATWIKLSRRKGFKNIQRSKVNWRRSDQNISPNNTEMIVTRKLNSCLEYFDWLKSYNTSNQLGISAFSIRSGFRFLFRSPSQHLSFTSVLTLLRTYKDTKFQFLYNVLYMVAFRVYFRVRSMIFNLKK